MWKAEMLQYTAHIYPKAQLRGGEEMGGPSFPLKRFDSLPVKITNT